MKYAANQLLAMYDGSPVRMAKEAEPLTFGAAIQVSCLAANPQEFTTAEQKYQLYKFAERVSKALKSTSGHVEFSMEEVVLLKRVIAGVFLVGAVGAVFDVLERPVVDPADASVA